MNMNSNHHKDATKVTYSCLRRARVASRGYGAIRDCPARLRLKYRVHAPE
jgi:hypothetical protein